MLREKFFCVCYNLEISIFFKRKHQQHEKRAAKQKKQFKKSPDFLWLLYLCYTSAASQMEGCEPALEWAGYALTELLAQAILCPETVRLLACKPESELASPSISSLLSQNISAMYFRYRKYHRVVQRYMQETAEFDSSSFMPDSSSSL